MSKFVYIKNSILKIVYFICIFAVINIVLISSNPIDTTVIDIVYMDFLMIFISLIFMTIDYRKWKDNYGAIKNAMAKEKWLDSSLLKSSSSFEVQLMRDIIEVKDAETDNKVNEIKEVLDEVNDYIAKWVHEIKIPISVCELIGEKIDEFGDIEGLGEVSRELRVEIERIKFLINQVMYNSRLSSYSENLQINEINLNKVVKDVVKRNATFFIAKNIELNLENLNFNVMSDEKWISYIIDQIINNACKYVDKDGKIDIYAREDDKAVRLFIRDNGIGIREKDIRRIFDKGFIGENGKRVAKSTGIGLYISKKIANNLKHNIDVKSEEGVYTEFTLCFYKLSDYFKVT